MSLLNLLKQFATFWSDSCSRFCIVSPWCPSSSFFFFFLHGLDFATIQGHCQAVNPYMCQRDIQEQSRSTHHLPQPPHASHFTHGNCFPGSWSSSTANVCISIYKNYVCDIKLQTALKPPQLVVLWCVCVCVLTLWLGMERVTDAHQSPIQMSTMRVHRPAGPQPIHMLHVSVRASTQTLRITDSPTFCRNWLVSFSSFCHPKCVSSTFQNASHD